MPTTPLNARISTRVNVDLDIRLTVSGEAQVISTLVLTPDEAATVARWLTEAAETAVHESRARRRAATIDGLLPPEDGTCGDEGERGVIGPCTLPSGHRGAHVDPMGKLYVHAVEPVPPVRVVGQCPDRHPYLAPSDTYRCQRPDGHEGAHARPNLSWP